MDEKRREKQQRRKEKVVAPTLMGEYKGIMLVPGAESLGFSYTLNKGMVYG